MVCEAVHGSCPPGEEVCHNDGVKSNNNWWNLRYDTHINNKADQLIHGTAGIGDKNPMAKLTWREVREIRAKFATGKYTQRALAIEYGVNFRNIHCIVNYLTWIE